MPADQLGSTFSTDGLIGYAEGPSSQVTPMVLVLGTTAPFWVCILGKAIQVGEAAPQREWVAGPAFKVSLLPQLDGTKRH